MNYQHPNVGLLPRSSKPRRILLTKAIGSFEAKSPGTTLGGVIARVRTNTRQKLKRPLRSMKAFDRVAELYHIQLGHRRGQAVYLYSIRLFASETPRSYRLPMLKGAASPTCEVTPPRKRVPPSIIEARATPAHRWRHGAVASVALARVTGRREWETEVHVLPPRLRLLSCRKPG